MKNQHSWKEKDIIELVKKKVINKEKHRSLLPIGDDAYIFKASNQHAMVITTDAMVENVHWRSRAWSPEELAYKLVAVNVSDMAAMGGLPERAFLTMAISSKYDQLTIERFLTALIDELKRYNIDLCGGDTTASASNLFLSLTLMGQCSSKKIISRNAAKPGDLILATGDLGGAVAGRFALSKPMFKATWRETVIDRFKKPMVRLEEGQLLANTSGVHAMMDISDGLASDIEKLTEASKTGAVIYAANLPVALSTRMAANRFKQDVLDWALTGGEDYELLFTCEAKRAGAIIEMLHNKFETPCSIIGEITGKNKKVTLMSLEGQHQAMPQGFEHKG